MFLYLKFNSFFKIIFFLQLHRITIPQCKTSSRSICRISSCPTNGSTTQYYIASNVITWRITSTRISSSLSIGQLHGSFVLFTTCRSSDKSIGIITWYVIVFYKSLLFVCVLETSDRRIWHQRLLLIVFFIVN